MAALRNRVVDTGHPQNLAFRSEGFLSLSSTVLVVSLSHCLTVSLSNWTFSLLTPPSLPPRRPLWLRSYILPLFIELPIFDWGSPR